MLVEIYRSWSNSSQTSRANLVRHGPTKSALLCQARPCISYSRSLGKTEASSALSGSCTRAGWWGDRGELFTLPHATVCNAKSSPRPRLRTHTLRLGLMMLVNDFRLAFASPLASLLSAVSSGGPTARCVSIMCRSLPTIVNDMLSLRTDLIHTQGRATG